jgi:tRNA(fMet)-specific endonuclease VapC
VKFLLDTDHISILQRKTEPEYSALVTRISRYPASDLGSSIISFHEQVLGCHTYINRARSPKGVIHGYEMLAEVLRHFAGTSILPFDGPAAVEFDRLQAQRIRIATMDLRIASIALSRGLVVLTRNTSDFGKIPGLNTEDWTL